MICRIFSGRRVCLLETRLLLLKKLLERGRERKGETERERERERVF
jgi:hypothetical protein